MSMSESPEGEGWIFQIAPVLGESFGHYLGRFRRANCLSRVGLAEWMTTDVRIVRGWEMPSCGQPLSAAQLAKISTLLGLSEAQLVAMLPAERSKTQVATRLCPKCYVHTPIHQQDWQRAELTLCASHEQPFLTACSGCSTVFRVPALWENGCCERCWLPFGEMDHHRCNQAD
jgi:hypothetical protein